MTQPAMTPTERQIWFEKRCGMNDEEPATPAEAAALRDYLDGQITVREAALRLLDGHDEHQGRAPRAEKPWRVAMLLKEAIFDIREQHTELYELEKTIKAINPNELRLTDEEKASCPTYTDWPGLPGFDANISDTIRLYDLEDTRYQHGWNECDDPDEHPFSNARRYVSLAEWVARGGAEDGIAYMSIAPMKFALETELVTEEWPIMKFRGQDPKDPYTAYDVEIPMVSAYLRHEAHLYFTPPGTHVDEEYKTWYKPSRTKKGLWTGRPGWSFERWTFWKQRLRWVIESKDCPVKDETREEAKIALAKMDEVEREYTK